MDTPHHHNCTLFNSGGCAALENAANMLTIYFSECQPDPRYLGSITVAGQDPYVKASYKLVNCSDDQNYHLLGMKINETLKSKNCPVKDLVGKYRLNHLLSKNLEAAKQQRRVLQAKAEERMLRNSPLFSERWDNQNEMSYRQFYISYCLYDMML